MQIRVGYEFIYRLPQPTPMILTVSIHYSRASDIVIPDHLTTDPPVLITAPPPYGVPDLAAWIEVYVGGGWYIFDPRNNVPRIGRVLIARGRDAADVAIVTTFGLNTLESFKIWTDEVAEGSPALKNAANA